MNRMTEGYAKLNHTPSMKAGQQSRHSCNQILQREAPAHRSVSWTRAQKRPLAGQGRQEGQRQEATTKGGQATRETPRPAQAQRGAQKPKETASPQEHKDSIDDTSPTGHHTRQEHRTDKEKEDSTDKAVERQIAQDLSKATMTMRTDSRRGVQQKTFRQTQNELGSASAPVTSTDRHTSTNNTEFKPYTWESKTPMHLPRLWTDAPVAKKTQVNNINKERDKPEIRGANNRSRPEQKGPNRAD